MDSKLYKTIYILALLILLGVRSINAQEVDDESEFDYEYNSSKGPANWGKLHKEWAACLTGSLQSPIDMSHVRVRNISSLEKKNYKSCNASVTNRGHDIQIKWHGDAGFMRINGSEYHLQSVHWHSPSEHTINGRRFDMELHLVHVCNDSQVKNNISVLAVLYQIGKPNKFLTKLLKNVSLIGDHKHREAPLGKVNPRKIIHKNRKNCYRYLGSLTVPPCTEGVIWTINQKVETVSRHQIEVFRDAVHDNAEENARPLQKTNSRDIYLYRPMEN